MWTIFLAVTLWAFIPTPAQADFSVSYSYGDHDRNDHWRNHGSFRHGWYRDRHHYHHHHYPRNYAVVYRGPQPYYYNELTFYSGDQDNYAVVAAPVGVVVNTIPVGYQRFIANGQAYYTYNGAYYVRAPEGYQVVEPPAGATVATAPESVTAEQVTVNVPNVQGGFTAVTIKKSGNGFVGPQGEFYNEFPKVEQLRVMYSGDS